MDTTQTPLYFISDAHLGLPIHGCDKREADLIAFRLPIHGCDKREADLIAFLRTIASTGGGLYILGDLFDFWIEYRRAIRPDYFTILCELARLVEKGIPIHYLAGNHDFALGAFLEKTVGIQTHLNDYDTVLQGKKLHLFHGDGLIRRDVGYRVLKKILRNPINQKIYKCLLHPNIGIPLGSLFSGSSRKVTSGFITEDVLRQYREHAKTYLEAGNDIVVFAHTHRPEIVHWNGKTYCNTGEWIKQYTFAKLENGSMSLWRYIPGEKPQEIGPGFP